MMSVAIRLYKRTSNLSHSEPRMTSDWVFKDSQLFEVPLFDNNKQCVSPLGGALVHHNQH